MARVEDIFLPVQKCFLTEIRRSTLEITHSRCPFILFNSYISTLEEVRKRDLAMFAKWWQGPEGCEGMIIKCLFRHCNFLAHNLIVEANFLIAESEMMEFIKLLKVRRLGAQERAVARSRADLGQ